MPWSKTDYPASMKNLPGDVRNKAIEIANALLEDGNDEGRSIAIAIDRARSAVGKEEKVRPHYEVEFKEGQWVLTTKEEERPLLSAETKEELLDEAREYVNEREGILTIYKENGEEEDLLYE